MTSSVHFSSKSAEHYTPPKIIRLCLDFWQCEQIDLDPCSNSKTEPNFPAYQVFTQEDDGLQQSWDAKTLFMNPPYGREIEFWVRKLVEEYELGYVKEAITLVPGRIDTGWFHLMTGYTACFVRGRLKFTGPGNPAGNPAPFPSVLFYLGPDNYRFSQHFSSLGSIWREWPCETEF